MNSLAEGRRQIVGLDMVRFWAACAVALFHLAFWSWSSPTDLPYRASAASVRYEALESVTWFGWLAVETFFVISGIVICVSAEGATPYQFARSRIARLYPAVWICASATAFVLLALHLTSPTQLLFDYLRSILIFSKGPWVDTVYRTLMAEGVFYALVLSLLTLRCFRHVEMIAISLGTYSLIFWLIGAFSKPMVSPGIVFYFSRNAIFFALGMMIWVIGRNGPSVSRIAILAILTSCGAMEIHFVSLGMVARLHHASAFVAVLVWLASIAAILISVFLNERISKAVGTRTYLIKVLGLITYPLYLIHDVIGSAVLRTSVLVGQPGALALAFLVSFGLAYSVVLMEPIIRKPLLTGLDVLVLATVVWRKGGRDAKATAF